MKSRTTEGAGPNTTGSGYEQLSLFDAPSADAETETRHQAPLIHDVIRGRRLEGLCARYRDAPKEEQ